jgi:osmotically-inducible protein OsmY
MAADTHQRVPVRHVLAPAILTLATLAAAPAFVATVDAQPRPTPRPVQPVDPDIAETIDTTDAEAALMIQERLLDELPVTDLTARVDDGVATLEGSVTTDRERRRAAAIARRVDGVRRVVNELEIDATTSDDPAFGNTGGNLETAVAAELRRDPVLNSRDIRVLADRRTNTVTLIGVVDSQDEVERATRVAEDAFAVGHVRNRLQVRDDR